MNSHVDLLNRALVNLHAEIRSRADMCEDPKEKVFWMGRAAGVEIAITLVDAWRIESAISEQNEYPLIETAMKQREFS